jgi:hypothetical protein
MKQKNQNSFSDMDLSEKMQKITEYYRNYLMKHHTLKDNFFLFDDSGKTYMIPIENKKFIDIDIYRKLFGKVVIEKIKEIEAEHSTTITNLFYIRKIVFDTTAEEIINFDDSWEEDEHRRASMVILHENKFNYDISVYDCISIIDKGEQYTLVSENPIKKLNLSKLDADHMVEGFLTNIIR